MKMSFSLSSLQPSSKSLEGPEHVRMQVERPYNSLTKKRKEPKQEHCQCISENREDTIDDFWASIRTNYDYIMDTNLIDSCKEANGELAWDEGDVSTLSWGLNEVSCQFSELYSWLRVLQELVYSKEENLLDKGLRAAHMEELRRKAYRRRLFNEQAGKLIARAPALRDEVTWRVDHLNAKWELVEQIMAPTVRPVTDHQDVSADFDHEVKCLRKWLREMETRMQPLSFHIDWSRTELEEKAMEHMVLQKDIEAHGRIVSSVVKLGEKLATTQGEDQQKGNEERQQHPALKVASSLERRWHLLFLRALEWQCHFETLASRTCNKNSVSSCCSSDSDEEPVTKQPRLSRRQSRESGREGSSSGQNARSTRSSGRTKRVKALRHCPSDPGTWKGDLSDSDVSSENRFIDDGSYFEDDLDELCVMETSAEEAKSSKLNRIALDCQSDEGDIEDAIEETEMAPTPDPVSVTARTLISIACDEIDAGKSIHAEMTECTQEIVSKAQTPIRRKGFEETATFNTSNRKSKNCATFYFKHRDTDSEADGSVEMEESSNVVDAVSSEDEWTYTNSRSEQVTCRKTNVKVSLDFGEVEDDDKKLSTKQSPIGKRPTASEKWSPISCEKKNHHKESDDDVSRDKYNIHRLVMEVEKLVREEGRVTPSRTFTPLIFEDRKGDANSNRAKYARIREWLKLNSMGKYDEKSNSEYRSLDSCDASGEYTTGESDVEKQSISSEDLHSSVATYRRLDGYLGCVSQSVSQEIFDSADNTPVNECHQPLLLDTSTPKVVLRSKRKTNGPRPWSVSCITQIRNNTNSNEGNDSISQFSISETALHQLVTSSPVKSASLDASGSSALFNKSTSTLLEETVSGQDARTIRTSSLRRRKSRLRKKTVSRKSESGSDGVNVLQTSGSSDVSSNHQCSKKVTGCRGTRAIARDSHERLTTLVKSGSFSGSLGHQELVNEKMTVSDPVPALRLTYCQSNSSTSDTEEEDDTCNRGKEHSNALNVDSDAEKNSLGNVSFSEQAWDNYQEKYMSEPYSETPDLDAARRLLDFGDDYRNFLDSQSDCASSMSAIRDYSSPIPRRRLKTAVTEDSDSDVEDMCKLIKKSHCQLMHAESCVMKKGHLMGHDCGEIVCLCRENIKYLHTILESSGISHRDDKQGKQIRGLLERWESLSSRLEEVQKANAIHRDMAAMHLEFRAAHDRIMAYEVVLEKAHVLDERINQITFELLQYSDICKLMKVVNSKDQQRHSRNCTVKKGPGQYEEPDVVSSSEEEQGEQINQDKTVQLINAVRKRQPLWDNRLTKVDRNPAIMQTLWEEVDAELGLEPGSAKTTWSSTRHKFSSERRRVESGLPSNWQYYPNLSFLIATRNPKPSLTDTAPQTSSQIVAEPKVSTPKRKKPVKNHQIVEESTQIIPVPVSRETFKPSKQPLYMPAKNSMNDQMKRELSIETSDSEVDVVEEINMRNGSILSRHMDNSMSYKRVCIRQMQQTEVQNLDDEEDDEIKRFCSYLEVMLRKMPKTNQELFCEETLDHLAAINRKLRRTSY